MQCAFRHHNKALEVKLEIFGRDFMTKQRITWMDFVRGICIALVVFVHTGSAFQMYDLQVPQYIDAFNLFMDPFRIPLLMFLSGMLLHKSFNKKGAEYFLGKFNLIFWPFLIWSQAAYIAEGRMTLEYFLKTPFFAPSLMWYLWFLCAFYVLAYFINKFKVPLLPVIAICLIASGFLPGIVRIDRFAFLFAFFLMGHLVAMHRDQFSGRAMIGLVGLALAVAGGWYSMTVATFKYDPIFTLVPVGLIAFLLAFNSWYSTSKISSPIEWAGRNSMVFYAVHFPVLLGLIALFEGTIARNPVASYFAIFAIAMAVSILVQKLRSKVKIVAALFDFRVISDLLKQRRSA